MAWTPYGWTDAPEGWQPGDAIPDEWNDPILDAESLEAFGEHVYDRAIADAPGASPAASSVSFSPAGNIAAETVQAAIQELDTEKAASGHTHATLPTSDEDAALAAAVGGLDASNPVISLEALAAGFSAVEQLENGTWPERPTLHGQAIPWRLTWVSQPGNTDTPTIGGTGMASMDEYIPVPEEEA